MALHFDAIGSPWSSYKSIWSFCIIIWNNRRWVNNWTQIELNSRKKFCKSWIGLLCRQNFVNLAQERNRRCTSRRISLWQNSAGPSSAPCKRFRRLAISRVPYVSSSGLVLDLIFQSSQRYFGSPPPREYAVAFLGSSMLRSASPSEFPIPPSQQCYPVLKEKCIY